MAQYKYCWGLPDKEWLEEIRPLHQQIFQNADVFFEKMKEREHLLTIIANEDDKAVGYKVGYALSDEAYYSWYGGVEEAYRERGIAGSLMDLQHDLVKKAGYRTIQTNTRNKWRGMLILNIKKGFDVKEVFIDDEGIRRIVLRKQLNDNKF
ncbi:GNAT family N-acetyltransferase [Sporosarcina cyprini]|uniref:GNAT family N-acetyltransferase n=1 Tax=Sporosarcina cyprini TaxID=2910523 RepID=UPI001EDD02B2|nr:GNAT family N-acetyltransferase [Sporosarcina cyprini]MCG3089511.1 GNAT family N-acetyltransferase [Sporosarcina cyprini]